MLPRFGIAGSESKSGTRNVRKQREKRERKKEILTVTKEGGEKVGEGSRERTQYNLSLGVFPNRDSISTTYRVSRTRLTSVRRNVEKMANHTQNNSTKSILSPAGFGDNHRFPYLREGLRNMVRDLEPNARCRSCNYSQPIIAKGWEDIGPHMPFPALFPQLRTVTREKGKLIDESRSCKGTTADPLGV